MEEPSVTAEYLVEQGINPESPMSSERIRFKPLRVRFGDDLIIRRSIDGGIERSFGYFADHQVKWRAAWSKKVFEEIASSPFGLMLLRREK